MTEEESEVFEITDFTTVSDWERFIARLEEIIHEWKLTTRSLVIPIRQGEISQYSWDEKSQDLEFANYKFIITRHRLKLEDGRETTGSEEDTEQGKDGQKLDNNIMQESLMVDTDAECNPVSWDEMMTTDNDFPCRAHCLCRWYGLQEFLVLTPGPDMDEITSESRASSVLSSISIALSTTGCQIPVFVQVHQKWRKLYHGQCELPGFRTSFEMVHLKNMPQQYNHLAGLLDVFKAKLACPVTPMPTVSVGVRFTYVLHEWAHYTWPQQPPGQHQDMDSFAGYEVGVTEFDELPFGACEDPVCELQLSVTWPNLSEEMIVDNDVYSDLNPLHAYDWRVRVKMADNPQCLLGDYLDEFVMLCRRTETTGQLLASSLIHGADNKDVDASQALQRLTEPVYKLPTIGTVVTRATSKLAIKSEEAPINGDLLNEILVFLFPDAKNDAEVMGKNRMSQSSESNKKNMADTIVGSKKNTTSDNKDGQYRELFRQLKSAPLNSLTHRLAVCMCIINHSYGGLAAAVHLWQEFILELRYRWEYNYTIPDLEPGSPNLGYSQIHQKLQMLNCCIERKKTRESMQASRIFPDEQDGSLDAANQNRPCSPSSTGHPDSISASSEEEFFDCAEIASDTAIADAKKKKRISRDFSGSSKDTSSPDLSCPTTPKKSSSTKDLCRKVGSDSTDLSSSFSEHDSVFCETLTHRPEGRLKPCGELHLLNMPEEQLYVPVTQEPAPVTEDMLEEQAQVLAKLGTTTEGSHLRARMQSACLMSDMESFKAANPGCNLGDFVRWYSPRDWLEEQTVDDQGHVVTAGQLSQRMQIPGNMWVEVWEGARAVPAHRQRRLFDDTKEAEKVLHWLSGLSPAEVAMTLIPMVIHAAIDKLLQLEESQMPAMKSLLSDITTRATSLLRAPKMDIHKFEDLVRQLGEAEVQLTQAQSLQTKLTQETEDELTTKHIRDFLSLVFEQTEVGIPGAGNSEMGRVIRKLFASAQKSGFMLSDEEKEEESVCERPTSSISDFPKPIAREFIMRTKAARPAPWSRPTPHRMYCVLMKDDFRLAGAFSQDTTFL